MVGATRLELVTLCSQSSAGVLRPVRWLSCAPSRTVFVSLMAIEAYGVYGEFCGEQRRATHHVTHHVTHHGGPPLALGREQRRLLLKPFAREKHEEFRRWLEMGGLPPTGMVEELVVRLDAESLAIKGARPRRKAPWSAMLRRLNPREDARVGKNLARAADSLERRGLVWLKPPRTEDYRRRKSCGLTDLGRIQAVREVEALAAPAEPKESRQSEIVDPHYL